VDLLVGGASAAPAPPQPPATTGRSAAVIAASPVGVGEAVAWRAVDAAVGDGATYADARIVRYRQQSVMVRDGDVQAVTETEEYGIGVRVIANGGWGFTASPRVTADSACRAARAAVQGARINGHLLSSLGRSPVELAPAPTARGAWVTPHCVDPFEVPIADKVALLVEVERRLVEDQRIDHAIASVVVTCEDQLFASSEGALLHQIAIRVSPSITAAAMDRRGGRSVSLDFDIVPMQAGWEYITALDLAAHAEVTAVDLQRKLRAPSVEPGVRTVILTPTNLWLPIHESIGHLTELDRAMGLEANYAGTSFIAPDRAIPRLGSPRVDIVADRTQPGGLATVAWDDDGVAAGRWDLVRNGTVVGWQTTRDQARWIGGTSSHGCSYGQGYGGVAFQRMPNVSLQPGPEDYSLDDLITATDDGVLIRGGGSWSIDQQRSNFQFSGQMFYEIKRGRIVGPLRDVAYQADTVAFWRSCDMLGGLDTYQIGGGTLRDGKGEPRQASPCSHGCPPARFTATILNTEVDR
jgi:TldD protein